MANFRVDTDGNLWIGTDISEDFATAKTEAKTKFYVEKDGTIKATSGTIGGIVVDADGVESDNYDVATDTGWRLDNTTGIAKFYDIDIILPNTPSGNPSPTSRIDIGNSLIYDLGNQGLTISSTALRTSKFKAIAIGTASNPPIAIQGDYDELGFYATNDNSFQYTTMHATNGTDDVFHWNGLSTNVTFHGNVTIQGNTLGVNGDTGSSNQYLGKDSNGTLGYHNLPSSSSGYYTNGIKINNLQMQDGYNFDVEAASGSKVSVTTRTSGGYAAVINHSDSDHSFSSGITSINSQTGSAITITSSFSNSGSPYVGVAGFSSNNNTISLGRSTQARCNILDPYSTSPKVGNSTSDRFSNIYSQSFYGTFYGQVINASSRNIKENIEDTALGLDFINDLTVKDFTMIDTDTFGTKKYTGFIAEEIEDYLAENNLDYKLTETYRGNYEYKDKCSHIVYCEHDNYNCEDDCCSAYFRRDRGEGIVEMYLHETVEDCEAYMPDQHRHPHLYFNNFIGPLVKAVQELSTQISDLTARVEALEG